MLDGRSLEAFEAAATELNFTQAARRAAMTQSGVSQHIARIEEELGVQLFQRVNRKVLLTSAGRILLQHIERKRENESRLLEAIQGEVGEVSGLVRYAMPHSCLFTPHLGLLLDARKGFPGVRLDITLCSNEEIFDLVLDQEIAFGFVTTRVGNPALHYEPFCQEEYVAVASTMEELKEFPEVPFVSYPGMDVLYRLYMERCFPKSKRLCPTALAYAGRINSLAGAITMVEKGVGATVVPRHCVAAQLEEGSLVELKAGGKRPLVNEIAVVWLDGAVFPARVRTIIDALWAMKSNYQSATH
ncbi:MAG: LysR family transcriptional regulator [Deltaproteobacteria bacterium]|nr:LysR family transcriptional regulator [Deltaproteobacteria bacterium]MBI3293200.1 LysR family transcriptional regulator [Deltaproteobacteria bacterium]